MSTEIPRALTDVLVDQHRQLLGFVERRLGDRGRAEDVLQAAIVKGLERGGAIRDERSVMAWFYRLLRNAIVDELRRRDVERRALEGAAREAAAAADLGPELEREVCRCLHGLLPTLKDEYGRILRAIDFEGVPAAAFAEREGISPANARVRLHRARKALRHRLELSCGTCAEHGCLDCSCRRPCGRIVVVQRVSAAAKRCCWT